MSVPHPIVQDVAGVRESVRFMKWSALEALPVPWPRCQDLPSSSWSPPTKDDFVVAVSHAWPYQAHPDPLGEKVQVMQALTEQACAVHRPRGRTLFFMDFLSTPQRPFAPGHAPRTPAEDEAFAVALRAFPLIYLMADTTLHMDVAMSPVPQDLDHYEVGASDLRGVQLQVVGPTVQVVDFEQQPCKLLAPFDIITSIGDAPVESLEEVDRFRNSVATLEQGSADWLSCCQAHEEPMASLQRAPFGRRNTIPAGVKGWIFLERFVSMVKLAMVPESCAAGIAFSNSSCIMEQIHRGGARLRAAAAGGRAKLNEALQEFAKELDTKKFAAISMDKVMNSGGVGGQRRGSKGALDKPHNAEEAPSDRDVVWELMQVLVNHLEHHWEVEAAAQRQRQLVLAVSRGDVTDVVHLIEARANPNAPDAAGRTSLHAAASFWQVDMVCTLLQHRADTTAEDWQGNLPVHVVSFVSKDATVELFDLLAPSEVELGKANVAGVSPLKKFAKWVDIECRDAPFPPAQRRFEELRAQFPHLLLMQTPGTVTRSSLSLGPAVKGLERYVVNGRTISVHVWEPLRREARVHVLFLALQWCLPWSLTEPAAGLLAESVCDRFGAKLWVVTPEALDATVLRKEAPISEFLDDLEAVVNALPLRDRFFLLESSVGMAVPVLWRIPKRLHGALLVNPSCFFNEEFEGTPMHGIFANVFKRQLELARARDPQRQASMHAQWSTAESHEVLLERRAQYQEAWAAAPENFWLWWGYGNLDIRTLSRVFWTLPPLPALPVTFAVGSLAPTPFTTEPVVRFQQILPKSSVAYIPNSRHLWDFEGEEPVCKVAFLLCELIEQSQAVHKVVRL